MKHLLLISLLLSVACCKEEEKCDHPELNKATQLEAYKACVAGSHSTAFCEESATTIATTCKDRVEATKINNKGN